MTVLKHLEGNKKKSITEHIHSQRKRNQGEPKATQQQTAIKEYNSYF
jgi:hypothetical protein